MFILIQVIGQNRMATVKRPTSAVDAHKKHQLEETIKRGQTS